CLHEFDSESMSTFRRSQSHSIITITSGAIKKIKTSKWCKDAFEYVIIFAKVCTHFHSGRFSQDVVSIASMIENAAIPTFKQNYARDRENIFQITINEICDLRRCRQNVCVAKRFAW